MTVYQLSNDELLYGTHAIFVDVADGDLTGASGPMDAMTLAAGDVVKDCVVDVVTAFTSAGTAVLDVGIAATATNSATLCDGADLETAGIQAAGALIDTAGASEFLTFDNDDAGTASAGQVLVIFTLLKPLEIADITLAS